MSDAAPWGYMRRAGGLILEPTDDLEEFAHWYTTANRRVREHQAGDARVSTVFLGVDHSFGVGPPVLWETMIFGGPHDGYQERYTSEEAAVDGHTRAVAALLMPLTMRPRW